MKYQKPKKLPSIIRDLNSETSESEKYTIYDLLGCTRPANPSRTVFLFVILIGAFFFFIDTPNASAATPVYYSVGQSSSNLLSGTSVTLTLTSGATVFNVAQTGNIGVGDRVTYDTDNKVAYIAAKTNADQKHWTLITKTGGTPTDVSGVTVTSIKHEYTSLSAAITGGKDSSHINNTDLTVSDVVLNIPCYYDSGPDTTAVTVSGYTTDATRYIKIYTPNNTSTEANNSQRHSGVWDTGKYRLEVTDNTSFVIGDDYINVEGLQIKSIAATTNTKGIYATTGSYDLRIGFCIIAGDITTGHTGVGINVFQSTSIPYIFNNIIYDFNTTSSYGLYTQQVATAYLYNNTVYNCTTGYNLNSRISYLYNNIAQSCTDGYYGTSNSTGDYNISNLANDAPSPSYRSNLATTVSFVGAGSSPPDFHLDSNDTDALGHGVFDPGSGLFSEDIDGQTRSGTWDIGADEYVYSGPTRSNGSPYGNLYYATTQTIISLETDVNATCKYDTLSGIDYNSMSNTFSNTGEMNHSSVVTELVSGGSYEYYVRCTNIFGANADDYTISFTVGSKHYVRSGATGTNDGSDWTNAYDGIPSGLTRGDIYVLAGGTYVSYDFDDAENGNDTITIRKASSPLDSAVSGWDGGYDSQVVFSGSVGPVVKFSTGYFVLNGLAGDGNGSTTEYGVKVTYTNAAENYNPMVEIAGDHVEIKYVTVILPGSDYDYTQKGFKDYSNEYTYIHHCHVKNASYGLDIDSGQSNSVYEFNYFDGGWGSSTHHQDYVRIIGTTDGVTIRYNTFYNVLSGSYTGLFVAVGDAVTYPTWYVNNLKIYGNIFVGVAGGGNGMFTTSNSTSSGALPTRGWLIYNNTFVDGGATIHFYYNASDHEFKNNIIYNCNAYHASIGLSSEYNYYHSTNTSNPTLSTGEFVSSESSAELFVDYSGGNYILTATSDAKDTGVNLGSPYYVDYSGTSRPQGSAWDIGAYEYVDIGDTTPPTVSAFTIAATATSLTVPITTFTVTDDTAVTGYLLTESTSTPDVDDPDWSATAQTEYTFSTEGAKTLYAWAKDAAGNISTSLNDSVTITLPTYTIGGTISGLTGTAVLQNNGGDDLTVSSNGSFTFGTALHDSDTYDVIVSDQPEDQTCGVTNGTGTISAANVTNISVTCEDGADSTAPTISAFSLPSTSDSLTVSITEFTATDDTAVTGYLLTESADAPNACDSGWEVSAQTEYTFSSEGAKSLFAWAKDGSGNVSASLNASVTITLNGEVAGASKKKHDHKRDLDVHSVKFSATATTITVKWKTDYKANSKVKFGYTKEPKIKEKSSKRKKSHSITIKNLLPDRVYYFKASSTDEYGNEDKSKVYMVRTAKLWQWPR